MIHVSVYDEISTDDNAYVSQIRDDEQQSVHKETASAIISSMVAISTVPHISENIDSSKSITYEAFSESKNIFRADLNKYLQQQMVIFTPSKSLLRAIPFHEIQDHKDTAKLTAENVNIDYKCEINQFIPDDLSVNQENKIPPNSLLESFHPLHFPDFYMSLNSANQTNSDELSQEIKLLSSETFLRETQSTNLSNKKFMENENSHDNRDISCHEIITIDLPYVQHLYIESDNSEVQQLMTDILNQISTRNLFRYIFSLDDVDLGINNNSDQFFTSIVSDQCGDESFSFPKSDDNNLIKCEYQQILKSPDVQSNAITIHPDDTNRTCNNRITSCTNMMELPIETISIDTSSCGGKESDDDKLHQEDLIIKSIFENRLEKFWDDCKNDIEKIADDRATSLVHYWRKNYINLDDAIEASLKQYADIYEHVTAIKRMFEEDKVIWKDSMINSFGISHDSYTENKNETVYKGNSDGSIKGNKKVVSDDENDVEGAKIHSYRKNKKRKFKSPSLQEPQ